MKKIFTSILTLAMVLPYSFVPAIAISATTSTGSIVIDTINGTAPTGHCIAGPLTFVVHGVTGSQGGPYHIDLGDGLSTTTSPVIATGGNVSFSNVSISFTPTQGGNVIILYLYHGSSTGADSHITIINQCVAAPTQGVLTVSKNVINDNGGLATPAAFTLHIKSSTTTSDVVSPFVGSSTGVSFVLNPGSYVVSENAQAGYTQTGISCVNGNVTVLAGQNYSCTITNDDNVPVQNTPPVSVADSYSTNEDTMLTVNSALGVLANDTDAQSNSLTAVLVSGVSNGSLTLNADGSFSYTPALNYNGSDSFTYKANDGTVNGNTVTVSITVNPVNDVPVANADAYSTNEDTVLNVTATGVLANDTDVEASSLTSVLVSGVSNGTLNLNADGSFDYTPNTNFVGTDSFTYKANDGTGDSNTVPVTITVDSSNDTPVAVADVYSTNEDTALTVSLPGVLANDTDSDSDPLTSLLLTGPTFGAVLLQTDGSFVYTPALNFTGADTFTYKANDGTVDSGAAIVTVNVSPVNDAPTVTDQALNTDQNTAVSGTLLATDVDVPSDVIAFATTSNPTNGTLTSFDQATGAFTYTPNTGYLGSDSFMFKANDGTVDSNTATTTITINPVTENTQTKCSDGIDNDGDNLVDLADPDCAAFVPVVPPPTPTPPAPPSGGGNGPVNFGFVNGGGSVLGASTTGQVLGESCGVYMDRHVRLGSTKNNPEQVKKLQAFLNKNLNSNLPLTGFYGPQTFAEAKKFQTKYSDEVLKPWGLTSATGLVYLSTLRQINNLECPELSLALPALVPWSQNPNAQ
jgi:VCBS repeat-containing protein